jgi:hypothetical protein
MQRKTAKITIIYDEDAKPFHLFLTGGGQPSNVRELCRVAVRGKRRQIKVDPEDFVLNLIWYAQSRTQVRLTAREPTYDFTYRINLVEVIPFVTYSDVRHNFFAWVGAERRVLKHPPQTRRGRKTGKRGRPSGLSKLYEKYMQPPPFEVRDGVAIYHKEDEKT